MQQLISTILDTWFSLVPLLFFTICVKTSRSVQDLVESHSLTAYDEECFLTVATFKTIYERFFKRRSITNTANFFHSSSDWGKRRTTERSRGGEEVDVRKEDRDRERAVNSINLCILIHILATPLISVSPAPFQISLHLMGGCSAWS